MTKLSDTATHAKRYLYGLVAVNLAIACVIVAFFGYRLWHQADTVEKILDYHSVVARAAQSATNVVHLAVDDLQHGAMDRASARMAVSDHAEPGNRDAVRAHISAITAERDTIATLQAAYADAEFAAMTETVLALFDAVNITGSPDEQAAENTTARIEQFNLLALRLRQLSRMHLAARDRLTADELYGANGTYGLLGLVGLLVGIATLAGIGVARNVAATVLDREAALRALAESEQKFALAFQLSPGMTAISELETGRHLDVNQKWVETIGYSREEAVGRTSLELGIWADPEDRTLAIEQFDQGSGFRDVEARFRTRDGALRDFLVSAAPFPAGERPCMLIAAHDITDLKHSQNQLARLNADLERRVAARSAELQAAQDELVRSERLATLGRLTATVSHELRNPLGAIRTSLYVIENGSPGIDERTRRAIARISRSITRCDNIIDELLDFTRTRDLRIQNLALDAWLDGTLGEQPIPPGIVVRKDFNLGGTCVPADDERLRSVIVNLYENACQSMETGARGEPVPADATRELTITTRRQGDRAEILFEDTGPGVPEDLLERIFEPLFSTKNFGVGLGLPIVRQILEQHGGGINVENRDTGGARFTLWLPLEPTLQEAEC